MGDDIAADNLDRQTGTAAPYTSSTHEPSSARLPLQPLRGGEHCHIRRHGLQHPLGPALTHALLADEWKPSMGTWAAPVPHRSPGSHQSCSTNVTSRREGYRRCQGWREIVRPA